MSRKKQSSSKPHFSTRSTVVCVTDQYSSERLIRTGKLISELSKTNLQVVHVARTDFSAQDAGALEFLFQISKENESPMTVLYSGDPAGSLSKYIKENKAVNVVTGMSAEGGKILPRVWRKFKDVRFFTVDENGQFEEKETVKQSGHSA